jgi:hypothetical protein
VSCAAISSRRIRPAGYNQPTPRVPSRCSCDQPLDDGDAGHVPEQRRALIGDAVPNIVFIPMSPDLLFLRALAGYPESVLTRNLLVCHHGRSRV